MIIDNVPGQYEASCFFAANKPRSYQGPTRCAGVNSFSTGGQCVTINDPKRGGFATRTLGKTTWCVKCMASANQYPDCQGKNCTMARILAGVPNIIDILYNRICTSMTRGAPYNMLREATASGYHRHRNISSHGQLLPPGSVTADELSRRTAHELTDTMHRQTATLVNAMQDILDDDDKKMVPPREIIVFKNLHYNTDHTGDPSND